MEHLLFLTDQLETTSAGLAIILHLTAKGRVSFNAEMDLSQSQDSTHVQEMKRFVTLIRVDVIAYATLIGQLEGLALMVTLPSMDAAIPVTFLMSLVTMEAILDAVE